jgi:hypothetical protein
VRSRRRLSYDLEQWDDGHAPTRRKVSARIETLAQHFCACDNSYMSWLNANAGAVTALLTLVLAVATIVYVRLTAGLLRENIAIREAATRPVLWITTTVHEAHINLINLVIENAGNGPALHVRFSVRQPVVRQGVVDLKTIGMFREGIRNLGAHQRVETFLANAIGNLDLLKKEPLVITVSYQDQFAKQYAQEFVIDFREMEGIHRVGEPPLYTIAKAAKELQSSIDRLVKGWHKLPVTVHTLQDLEREGKVSELWLKLNEMDAKGWEELEKFVAARVPHDDTPPPAQPEGAATSDGELNEPVQVSNGDLIQAAGDESEESAGAA